MSSSSAPKVTVLLLAFGLCQGSVIPIASRIDASQVRVQDELGQYHFAHVGGPNSREETRLANGITSGSYSYVDGHGLVQSAAYVSDPVNGFRVAATNLPAGPAVPAGAPAAVAAAPVVAAAPAIAATPVFAAGPALVRIAEPAPIVEAQPAEQPKSEEPAAPAPEAPSSTEAPLQAAEESSPAAPASPEPAPSSEAPAPAPQDPYVPVQDTPEVIAARQQHLAAFQEAQARDAAVGTEDPASTGEPTETPETPEPTEYATPSSTAAPATAAPEAAAPAAPKEAPQPAPALLPAAIGVVGVAGPLPAVPVAPLPAVAAVAAPAVARVAAVAAPSVAHVALAPPVADAAQYRYQDELGQYAFGHAGGPNAREEVKTADGVTRGGYAYVDGNGLVQSAQYLADPVNGFRVAATNIPVQPLPSYIPDSPEVAEAKAALFRAQQEHVAKL